MGLTRLSSIHSNKVGYKTPISFTSLITTKVPWARYNPANLSNNVWYDDSGNNRHATTSNVSLVQSTNNGLGSGVSVYVCQGIDSSTVVFPAGSIPQNYTICCLTRYTNTFTGRVLSGNVNDNFTFGHYRASRGVVFDGLFPTSRNSIGNLTDWLNLCVVRGSSIPVPNNVLLNGIGSGTSLITNNAVGRMAINTNRFGENSHFEISHVIIWDVPLTSNELNAVSNAFTNYLNTGVLI